MLCWSSQYANSEACWLLLRLSSSYSVRYSSYTSITSSQLIPASIMLAKASSFEVDFAPVSLSVTPNTSA